MVRPVIQSRKHIFQVALASQVGVGVTVDAFITAIEGARTLPEHVAEGCSVKAFWLELWIQNSAPAIGSFTFIVYKNPGGSNNVASADMAALHDWDNKKNILYTTQGLAPGNEEQILNIFKGWIKIPKGKQRFGLGDKMQFAIRNNTTYDINFCGLVIYKEYN